MRAALRRREFLAGALSLAGCRRSGKFAPGPSQVSIARAADYGGGLYDLLRRILAEHHPALAGRRVLLKPNLVEFEPGSVINTHPVMVHAALEAFRSLGAEVRIAEGPGHRRNTLDLADAAGYFRVIPRFEELFTDLNTDDPAPLDLSRPTSRLRRLYLPRTALACDLLVSMPKMKTHHWTGATLSMKNLFGLVPGAIYGWPKNVLHWSGIHECIVDLYHAFPRSFAIVDGVVGMEGNGPIQGTPKAAGVVVAGPDLAAVDATCCRLMRIEPAAIGYLRMAAGPGALTEARIRQIGEPVEGAGSSFELIPEFRAIRLRNPGRPIEEGARRNAPDRGRCTWTGFSWPPWSPAPA